MKGFYDIFCICSPGSVERVVTERVPEVWGILMEKDAYASGTCISNFWLIGELFVIVARSHCQSSDYGYKHFTCFHILIVLMNMIRTKNLCLLFQNKTNLNNYE